MAKKNSVASGVANKAEQIEAVLAQLGEGAKKKDAEVALNAVSAAFVKLMNEGKKFTIDGLGTFDHKLSAGGRDVRNPSTGELTGETTKDKHVAKFKASSTLSIPQP